MVQQLRFAFRLIFWSTLIALLLVQCKKAENTPITPTPTPPSPTEIKPGENVGLGAILLTKEEYVKLPLLRDPLVGARLGVTSKDPNLPAVYDLTAQMPPVGNQAMQGSCTAWAVAYAARSYFNTVAKNTTYIGSDGKLNEEAVFSPAFVYNQAKEAGDCIKTGTYIYKALNLLQTSGVCSLKDMPYNVSDCTTQPTVEQKQKAANQKIKSWGRVNINTNTFRRYLYFNYPIIIAQLIDKHFDSLTEKDNTGEYIIKAYTEESSRGPHAMLIVGYDDARKAFKVQNSWSNRWANKGYIWVSYDLVETTIREAYVMVAGDNSGLQPPKVQTGMAVKAANGQVTMTGVVTNLGDEPVLKYGMCVSNVRELPTTQYEVTGRSITTLPHSYTVTPGITGNRLYYRAFAETPTTIVYGDTASVTPIQSLTQPTGIGKGLLLFKDNQVFALNIDNGTVAWKSASGSTYGTSYDYSGVISGNVFCVGGASPIGFNLADGTTKWARSNEGYAPGESAFPVSDNGTVYNIKERLLQAIDANTGTLRWQVNVQSLGERSIGATTINGNTLYINTSGSNGFKLFSVDAATGRQIQQLPISSPYGNPLISNNILITSDGNSRTDGGMRSYSLPTPQLNWTSQTTNGGTATLVNNLVYSTTYSRSDGKDYVVAIDKQTGVEKWRYTPQGKLQTGSLSVDGNSVAIIASSNGTLTATYSLQVLDATTGTLRWEKPVYVNNFTLVAESKVYVRTGGASDATITAYDVNTGQQIWQSPNLGVLSPGPMCLITAAGKVYYMPQSGMQQ